LLKDSNRYHTVQEFNKGVYDYIIATDESGARGEHDSDDEAEAEEPAEPEEEREYQHFT
jgi:ATP-dependent RNA helicase DDX56/DBP9